MSENVQSIAPLLASHFIEADTDMEDYEQHNKFLNENASRIGPFKKYLGSLSDSWVLKSEVTNERF